ncbi:type-2 ice-structuring protein-like isoform X2 [Sebastes fasciatus]|uniref:type-2 ice-structuring protein-like isoform X2 n=1 Tax=Sebastes fasciatus TaxID=394691 RepID=UPI003D9E7AF0
MKMLTVSLLVCALMALAATQDDVVEPSQAPEATDEPGTDAPDGTAAPDNSTEAQAVEFFPFQCRLYGFVATPMTWATAEKHCQTMGANLASVHSKDEYQYLLQFTKQNNGNQETWLGGSDCHKEGEWLWSDGSVFEHTEWCDGRPDDECHVLNCLQMNYGVDFCWDDNKCSATRSFVCAKPVPCCPESPCPVEVPSDQ